MPSSTMTSSPHRLAFGSRGCLSGAASAFSGSHGQALKPYCSGLLPRQSENSRSLPGKYWAADNLYPVCGKERI